MGGSRPRTAKSSASVGSLGAGIARGDAVQWSSQVWAASCLAKHAQALRASCDRTCRCVWRGAAEFSQAILEALSASELKIMVSVHTDH
jgi:hypothetical protein